MARELCWHFNRQNRSVVHQSPTTSTSKRFFAAENELLVAQLRKMMCLLDRALVILNSESQHSGTFFQVVPVVSE
eukprot:m.167468 g.167468  ORF g.167468 m.167468 type:complete len:75 (+) comp14729_c0_seq4:4779-5003(+)